ncbi:PHD finger protein enhancer of yellow 3 isoform X1 [Cotesia typhae]|uniref:PHD finger protein enhancer of yellow 3 isoform X1 n=1 Tax=Cotesia typhae TaxID=2053667 RepID=UPI003D68DCA7
MSDSSKMGLFGSKEENSCLNSDQANKDESPERYAPYSVDSDSETYDTEALSIMDINDIIGVQSEPVDSTLESEIAALSKIMTDSKTDIVDKNTINTNLNVNTIEATPSINLLTNSGDKQSEISVKNNDSTNFQLGSSDVDTESNTLSIKNTNEFIQHQETSTNFDIKETGENYKSSNVTDVLSINKSLQLIGDAYTSEDSQEIELDEVRVDEEPKVVFSCKPLVDKQNSKIDHENNLEGIESIDIPVDVPSIVDMNIENNEILEKSSESIVVGSDNDNKLIDQANNDTNSRKLVLDQAKQIVSEATCSEDELPVQAPINVFTESTSSLDVAQSYPQDKEHSLKKDSDLFVSKETKIKPDNEIQLCQADLSVNNVEFSGIDSNIEENSTLVDDEIDDNNQNILTPQLEETSSNITQNIESLITSSVTDEDVANILSTADEITNEANSTTDVKEIIDQLSPAIASEYSSSVTENLNLKDLCEKLSSEDQTSVANNTQMSIVEKSEENILCIENKSKETNEVAEKPENKNETMEIINIEAFDVKDKIIEESETTIECNKSILLPSCSFKNEEEKTKDVIEENTLECINNILDETEEKKTDLKDNYIKDSSENIKSDVSCEDVKSIENDKNTNVDLYHDNHQLLLEENEKSDINNVQKPNSLITNTKKDIPLSKSNETSEELDANILEPSAQSFIDENKELSTVEVTSKPTEESNEINLEVVTADKIDIHQIIQDDPGIHSEKITEPIADLKLNLDTQEADTETLVVENVENLLEIESEVINFKSITSKSKDLNEKNCLDSLKSENLENPLVGVLNIDLTTNLEESVNSAEVIVHSEVIEESAEKISCELEQNTIVDLLLVSKSETEPTNQINNLLSDIMETETESSELDCNIESENERQTEDSENTKIIENSDHEIYEKETKCIEEERIININNATSEIKENLNFSPNEKLETDEVKDQLEDVNSITEVLQTNPEISELESAVKFLRESEEQNELETSLLSKPLDDTANELNPEGEFSTTYIQDQKISQDLPESESDFETLTSESITISEAEIITEAAKLESERKQLNEESLVIINQDSNLEVNEKSSILITHVQSLNEEVTGSVVDVNIEVNPSQCLLTRKTALIPKTSILEERLKEPPKIEIPVVDSATAYDGPITPRSSLLIQKDAKMPNYEQLLESSKVEMDKIKDDNKITDNVRKDSDRHEVENISSPSRIILKIAKSAIASCGEPKSPKSPKIRSTTDSLNLEDSPGHKLEKIKLKLSKGGHPSIIPNELAKETSMQWHTESSSSLYPLGIKRKFTSVQPETKETSKHKVESITDSPKRTESPIAMKIKLSKSGDASIIQSDTQDDELKEIKNKEKIDFSHESKRTESPLGVKIKRLKTCDPSISPCDYEEGINTKIKEKRDTQDNQKRTDSPIPVKMKLSKVGGASIITVDSTSDCKDKLEIPEVPRRTESPLGTKIIKMSKTGDASIIYSEVCNDQSNQGFESSQTCGLFEPSTSKDIDSTNISKKSESSLAVKIKVSKDGEAKIVHSEKQNESQQLVEIHDEHNKTQKSGDLTRIESMKIKLPKSGHPMIVTNDTELLYNKDSSDVQCTFIQKREQLTNRSEVTIEPITYNRKQDELSEHPLKRKDGTSNSYESKKTKLEAKLSQILPEVTIQPIMPKDQQQQSQADYNESNASLISREQMNVINQEISITQVKLAKPSSDIIGEKLKSMLTQSSNNVSDDCEIIEQDPELIIVNENSNSSQDIMIIDEVAPIRVPDVKVPKKRGRPRRNALPFQRPETVEINQDPLAIDETPYIVSTAEPKENERPKRTCRSQKSYAPPKRGRGRGRGKRKFDRSDIGISKKMRLEQNLSAIENSTTALITLDEESTSSEIQNDSSELYKALRQPLKVSDHLKKANDSNIKEPKESSGIPDHQNWLTPLSKKQIDNNRNDGISMVQVLDEETRMSAESVSRSQTPARSIPNQETTINEESQGSVISTATTESEKVKVKNRRMEINFDPDEGPFTVEKIAEYEWPLDRKGETFMIQEQISQYLGVKSFKRKYPDLKRRMVDMEERNYLRENLLVNEAMCDMGLTAICSSEVLDIMCSDFPDQYEEYRKHMREKQIKEHSKKQKELTAAANAEKNRIDLAEMAVQSALSWNVNFNKARNESRRCSLDLQTFTIHVPTKQPKINDENKISHYPVALIPGQYTDYYREYTPAELRYYPLNTVLYGPMRPNERKFDSQSEGSQSDSDSDSSSDDSSCSSSEGTQDTEESQSTMDDVDIELSNQKDKSFKCKMCLKHLNKNNKTEVLIQCGTCHGHVHPSCLDLTLDMVPHIHAYAWQCTDCKTCAQCHDPADEDKMLFCDMCDRGYHIYCVGLRRVPQGRWHCQECAICASCGSREAGGMNADRNSVAQWQHEYKKGDKNTRIYVSTLCVPCSKLWRKGRYCPHCSRCHTVSRLDVEENLVHCSACDKYLHLGIEIIVIVIFSS